MDPFFPPRGRWLQQTCLLRAPLRERWCGGNTRYRGEAKASAFSDSATCDAPELELDVLGMEVDVRMAGLHGLCSDDEESQQVKSSQAKKKKKETTQKNQKWKLAVI